MHKRKNLVGFSPHSAITYLLISLATEVDLLHLLHTLVYVHLQHFLHTQHFPSVTASTPVLFVHHFSLSLTVGTAGLKRRNKKVNKINGPNYTAQIGLRSAFTPEVV